MVFGYECHGGVSRIKRGSAMSRSKPHDVKFKLKVIECAKKTTKRGEQHHPLFKWKKSAGPGHSTFSPKVLF